MIESMAGKSAALHGITHDCTPFQFSEDDPAADYMGDMLVKGIQEFRRYKSHWRLFQSFPLLKHD